MYMHILRFHRDSGAEDCNYNLGFMCLGILPGNKEESHLKQEWNIGSLDDIVFHRNSTGMIRVRRAGENTFKPNTLNAVLLQGGKG